MTWYNSSGETAINILNGLTISLAGFSMMFLPDDYSKTSLTPIIYGAIMFAWYYGKKNNIQYEKDEKKLAEKLGKHRELVFHISLIPYYIYFIIVALILFAYFKKKQK
jgi:hypothetical protein